MWKNDGQDRLTGNWNVLQSQGHHVRLQLAVDRGFSDDSRPEVRNFELELDDEENGFRLSEEGADPHFGALYFKRVEPK
jgi:hypothetical protein